MRCPDCGGKKYRRNMDQEFRELERRWLGDDDFEAGVRLLRMRMRMGEIPEDYVRRAAALGDARAEALGLEPWPVDAEYYHVAFDRPMLSILKRLPGTLISPFAADAAERVLFIYEDAYPGDTRFRDAIEVARRWVEDPSQENAVDLHEELAPNNLYVVALWAEPPAASYAAYAAAYAADTILRYPTHYAAEAANFACRAADNPEAEEAWQRQRLIQYLLGEVQL